MSPVYKLSTSSLTSRTTYGSMLAGNSAYEIPADYHFIATQTVGSGGAASVTFTSIPNTYKQLEIRFKAKSEYNGGNDILLLTEINYAVSGYYTVVYGANSSTNTSGYTANYLAASISTTPTFSSNAWASGVMTFSDYVNNNKFPVAEGYSGWVDGISTGSFRFYHIECRDAGQWIQTLKFKMDSGSDIAEGSQFSLYGIGA